MGLFVVLAFLLGIGTHSALAEAPTSSPSEQHTAETPTQRIDVAQANQAPAEDRLQASPTPSTSPLIHSAAPRVNKLKWGTVLELPDHIKTVQQGANYVLLPTGYSLMVPNDGFVPAMHILNRSIPPQARTRGHISIEQALLTIAGDDVRLVVDHVNKLVLLENI